MGIFAIVVDDEGSVLRVRASARLTLEFERDLPYGPENPYMAGMIVRGTGDHVRVEQQVILQTNSEFPVFLRSLYDDFRGWSGERTWRSLNNELRVTARHDGHVHLHWELTYRRYGESSWTFSTTTLHDAGEDMRHLADAFDLLLNPPD